MKKQLIPYLFVALAFCFIGVLIAYIFMPKQPIKQNVITGSISRNDSVEIIKTAQEKFDKKLKQDSASLSKQRDSFKVKYYEAKADLNLQRQKVVELSNVILSWKPVDTSSKPFTLNDCLSLAQEARKQDSLIGNLQKQADSLQVKNDSLSVVMGVRVNLFQQSFAALTAQAKAQANIIDSLTLKNNSLIKKANKKYSVGIGVIGGLTPTGLGGCVGISITKTLFKF